MCGKYVNKWFVFFNLVWYTLPMIDKIIDWLVVSSANPEEHSMTLRGSLLQFSGVIFALVTMFGLGLTESDIIKIISLISISYGTFLQIVGLLRKLYYEAKRFF